MAGIKITGGCDIQIENVRITGMDVGIELSNAQATVKNAQFDRVRTPYKITGSDVRVSDSHAVNMPPAAPAISGSAGLRGTTAPAIPAQCTTCNSIFPSRKFTIFNANIHSHGNTETCLVCGAEGAVVATGLFRATVEIIELLAGPEESRDQLLFLQRLTSDVASGKLSVSQASIDADVVRPGLGKLIYDIAVGGWIAFEVFSAVLGTYVDLGGPVPNVSGWVAETMNDVAVAKLEVIYPNENGPDVGQGNPDHDPDREAGGKATPPSMAGNDSQGQKARGNHGSDTVSRHDPEVRHQGSPTRRRLYATTTLRSGPSVF